MSSGWNRPTERTQVPHQVRSRESGLVRGLLVGGLVILLAAVVAFFFFNYGSNNDGRSMNAYGKNSIREVKPAKSARPILPKILEQKRDPAWEKMKSEERGTNVVVREGIPVPLGKPNEERKGRPHIFRNAIEQLLAMAVSDDPTMTTPPVPISDDEELDDATLARGLENILKPEEGDDESSLLRKITVTDLKEEFRQLREKEGWTFAEYVRALQRQHNLNAEFYAEACQLDADIYHDEKMSDSEYLAMRKQINEKLNERGLPDLPNRENQEDSEPQKDGK